MRINDDIIKLSPTLSTSQLEAGRTPVLNAWL
jgi:hypothetical protein